MTMYIDLFYGSSPMFSDLNFSCWRFSFVSCFSVSIKVRSIWQHFTSSSLSFISSYTLFLNTTLGQVRWNRASWRCGVWRLQQKPCRNDSSHLHRGSENASFWQSKSSISVWFHVLNQSLINWKSLSKGDLSMYSGSFEK